MPLLKFWFVLLYNSWPSVILLPAACAMFRCSVSVKTSEDFLWLNEQCLNAFSIWLYSTLKNKFLDYRLKVSSSIDMECKLWLITCTWILKLSKCLQILGALNSVETFTYRRFLSVHTACVYRGFFVCFLSIAALVCAGVMVWEMGFQKVHCSALPFVVKAH